MLKRLFKETLTYAVAGVISRMIGILLIPIYTRVFSPEQFGLFDILLTTSTIFVLLSGLQVETGVGRSYYEAKEKGRHPHLVGTGLSLCFMGAMALWLILIVGYPFIPQQWIGNQSSFLLAVALSILPTQILNVAQIVLRMERMIKQFLILSIGEILTTSSFCVVTVVYGHFGIGGVVWSIFASKLFWMAIGAVWLKPFYSFKFERAYAKEILVYSLPTVPNALVAWCQNSASRYILASAMTLAEVGLFGLAVRIGSPVAMLLIAFRMAWYSYSLEIMITKEFREKCAKMLDIYWLIGFPICAVVAATGELLIFLLASKTYMPAGGLTGFIVMGILWSGAQQIVGLGTDYVRKTYLAFVAFTVGAGTNILILLLTVKKWGIVGAGLASLAGHMGATVVLMLLSQKQHPMPFRYNVMLWVGGCSMTMSIWCLWGGSPQADFSEVLLDTLRKGLAAIAMSILVILVAASKEEKASALRIVVSGIQKFISKKPLAIR
jgi:O-antigen/teichoic acid export membrane protein